MLQGGPGVPEVLGPLAEFLLTGFQVIYFHQRSTLNSLCPSGNYSMGSYLSDIDSIADHFNQQKFHFFGHSWGGLYAQLYAAKRQGKLLSMFLSSPAPGTSWQWAEMVMEVARFNRKKSFRVECLDMIKCATLGMFGSFKAFKKFYALFSRNCNKGYAPGYVEALMLDHLNAKAINRTTAAILLHPRLPKLPDPDFNITVTLGDDDIYGDSPKYIRERHPAASFITIPDSSHFSWLHSAEAFFEVLADHSTIKHSL